MHDHDYIFLGDTKNGLPCVWQGTNLLSRCELKKAKLNWIDLTNSDKKISV